MHNPTLHNIQLAENGVEDAETLDFLRDLKFVFEATHQSMAIIGPWMEARVKAMTRRWAPEGWSVSGPSQMFDTNRRGIRTRSWDLVVHRTPTYPLPAQASPEMGFPLLPIDIVAAVVDTKTNFSDPKSYSGRPVFNLANDATEAQLAFLGSGIAKIVLAATSSRSPDSMLEAGAGVGLSVFSLGRYQAGLVSELEKRMTTLRLERHKDGSYPLQRFKKTILQAIEHAEAASVDRRDFRNRSSGTPPLDGDLDLLGTSF